MMVTLDIPSIGSVQVAEVMQPHHVIRHLVLHHSRAHTQCVLDAPAYEALSHTVCPVAQEAHCSHEWHARVRCFPSVCIMLCTGSFAA